MWRVGAWGEKGQKELNLGVDITHGICDNHLKKMLEEVEKENKKQKAAEQKSYAA